MLFCILLLHVADYSVCHTERTHFYARSDDIPLPRSGCSFLAALRYASAGTAAAVLAHSKALVLPDFVKGERSECISPLTTLRTKHPCQGWVVSRSEAIHLTDAVALGEGAKRLLQGRGQGEAKPPIARPDVRH